jgi:predicted RNase H-like HicB family nuclease
MVNADGKFGLTASRRGVVHCCWGLPLRQVKIIVEKHADGYVAYPPGVKGVVVGQGGTYEEAVADVKSAIKFHVETFGDEVMSGDPPVL